VGEGAKKSEARCHPDRTVVDAAGLRGESYAPYPGRAAVYRRGNRAVERGNRRQQSAEAVVAACARR
jgi:hypothetical protein